MRHCSFFIVKIQATYNRPGSVFFSPVMPELLMAFKALQEIGSVANIKLVVLCGIKNINGVDHG